MAGIRVRRAVPADRDALYRICFLTGDSGDDATGLYDDAELLGHVYAGPYLALEPAFAFVAEDADGVAGYVLGALDTRAFEERCEREWWPPLRARYPDPGPEPREGPDPAEGPPRDGVLARILHHPPVTEAEVLERYPAHLHIDLLPRLQGRGAGRALMTTLLGALRDAGAPGVHLGVGARNTNAIGYYEHMGFATLRAQPWGRTMVMDLTDG